YKAPPPGIYYVGVRDVVDARRRRFVRRRIWCRLVVGRRRRHVSVKRIPGKRTRRRADRQHGSAEKGHQRGPHRGELTASTFTTITGSNASTPNTGARSGTSAAIRTVGRSYRAPVRGSVAGADA